jgi:hypothetical protein
LALWKVINEEDAVLFPQKIRGKRERCQRIFALGFLWGGVSRYATTPLIVDLSPVHSYTSRFRPWSPIASDGKSLDRVIKIPKFAQAASTVDVINPR